MSDPSQTLASRLNDRLTAVGIDALAPEIATRFEKYAALLLRWNDRINLTAIREEPGILSRHFVESIACAHLLPVGITSLLDFGSGAGFPGIPIALCRPEIAVTLAESQGKKAAFLREAVRTLGISAHVHSGRAESLTTQFDCVTLRAVDRMPKAVENACRLVVHGGWLALLTSGPELEKLKAASGIVFSWPPAVSMAGGDNLLLAIGSRRGGSTAA